MRNTSVRWKWLVGVAAGLQLLCLQAEAAPKPKNVVIHLIHFNDNPHAVAMSLALAQGLQQQGAKVTLLLDVEGVRLADAKSELAWHEPGSAAPEENAAVAKLTELVKAGMRVLVCKHCAEVAHMTEASLRPGMMLVLPPQSAKAILEADRVVDY